MVLTAAEKEKYCKKYSLVLWKTVHHFKKRIATDVANKEDLYQECVVVLLDHASNARNLSELHRIPIRDMINAMCRYILGNQAVSYPTTRTSDFSRTLKRASGSVELSVLDREITDCSIDEILQLIDFEAFAKSLTDEESSILTLKRKNYTNREVARTLGSTDVIVTRRLKRMRHIYEAYQTE